jgi:hypothetical protein
VKGSQSRKRTEKVEEDSSNIGPSQQELFKWNPLVDVKYDDWISILLSSKCQYYFHNWWQRSKEDECMLFYTRTFKGEID